MLKEKPRFIYFGSSRFSEIVLAELEQAGYTPIFKITSAHTPLPSTAELQMFKPDLFIVASFGKILPQNLIELPTHGALNIHPSLLPKYRGPSPIQNQILEADKLGVSVIQMDAQMDHGPILAQEEITIAPWPDHYAVVEEKLARAGAKLLIPLLANIEHLTKKVQEDPKATYTKLIKKEDGLLDLASSPQENWRKVLAYSTWPGAHFYFQRKTGEKIRVVVKDAEIIDSVFTPTRIIPAGKREMVWSDFLRGNA